MDTWLANQSDQVTCQPGTIAIGNAGVGLADAVVVVALGAFLATGNDLGDTGEGDSIGESWSGSRGFDASLVLRLGLLMDVM